jgi:hypothetical protein
MKRTILTAFLAACAANAYAGQLTLIPVNATTSHPGGVTGWGYDIMNVDPSNFMVLNDSFVSGSLLSGTYGVYVDYIASQSIVIGPGGDTGSVAFQPGVAGVGEFDFKKFVPIPTTVPGAINIDYSLFSTDPNSPSFDPGSFVSSGTLSASASASVVPEPSPVYLLALGVLPLAFALQRRGGACKPTAI